jgi:hypothetical protein
MREDALRRVRPFMAYALLVADVALGPCAPAPPPQPTDALPEPFRDNAKIRAAMEKRARKAAKRRK